MARLAEVLGVEKTGVSRVDQGAKNGPKIQVAGSGKHLPGCWPSVVEVPDLDVVDPSGESGDFRRRIGAGYVHAGAQRRPVGLARY